MKENHMHLYFEGWRCRVFNTTFNKISVILWGSVLLVEETIDLLHVTDKLYPSIKTVMHLSVTE
jgi:hypothetical protein